MPTATAPKTTPAQKPVATKKRALTPWENFIAAGLAPVVWESKRFNRLMISSPGTNTKLPLNDPEFKSILNDIDSRVKAQPNRGATFKIQLKPSRTPWKGWQVLEDAGVEILDLRSAQDEGFQINPPYHAANLQKLLATMPDANGKLNPKNQGLVWLTVTPKQKALSPEALEALTNEPG